MDIWNVDKLALFLIFFIPGFISMKVYDLIVLGERRDFSKSLVEAISYSAINFAALSWLIAIVQTGDYYHNHFILFLISVFVILFAFPVCWPFAFLGLSSWRPIGKHDPFWIIVHLKNGQKIGGFFGRESFASSNPADEQIFLEEVWMLDDDDRFLSPAEGSRGIIIMNDEIRAVEFFRVN